MTRLVIIALLALWLLASLVAAWIWSRWRRPVRDAQAAVDREIEAEIMTLTADAETITAEIRVMREEIRRLHQDLVDRIVVDALMGEPTYLWEP